MLSATPIVIRHGLTREPIFTCHASGDYSTAEAVSRGVREATLVGLPLAYADFSGLDLRRADFRCMNAPHADFRECALAGADFTATFLAGARFDGCGSKASSDRSRDPSPCARVNFSHAILTDANLSRARMPGSDWIGASLIAADLWQAVLSGGNFESADLRHAILAWAAVARCHFRKAHLSHADLSCALGCGSVFVDADLRGAILKSADLNGSDLKRAKVDEGLRSAWTFNARMPDDFDHHHQC